MCLEFKSTGAAGEENVLRLIISYILYLQKHQTETDRELQSNI